MSTMIPLTVMCVYPLPWGVIGGRLLLTSLLLRRIRVKLCPHSPISSHADLVYVQWVHGHSDFATSRYPLTHVCNLPPDDRVMLRTSML